MKNHKIISTFFFCLTLLLTSQIQAQSSSEKDNSTPKVKYKIKTAPPAPSHSTQVTTSSKSKNKIAEKTREKSLKENGSNKSNSKRNHLEKNTKKISKKFHKTENKKLKNKENISKKEPAKNATPEPKILAQKPEAEQTPAQKSNPINTINNLTALREAQYYFLVDPDNKEILLSKNADVRIPPSSMTKLMTAYVVFDQIKKGNLSFDKQCKIGKDAFRKSGSSMFLNYGDIVSIDKLLQGLLAVSGNDAAIALAENISGSVENFVTLMNSEAKELGLTNSHFRNPHGLNEDGHYMSIKDLAVLTTKLYKNFPEYSYYLGIEEFTYQNVTQKNRNPLIKQGYDGVLGGKTGHTNEGGYGVVGAVKRDNRRLIAVVNKATTPRQRASIVTQLLDYGFARYKKLNLFEQNQTIGKANTWLGDKSQLDLVANQEISVNTPIEQPLNNVSVRIKYKDPIYAPIKQGAEVATLVLEVKDYKTFEYPLFAKEKVNKAGFFRRINQVLRYKMAHFFNRVF